MFAPSLIPDVTFLDDGPEQHLGLLQRMMHGLRHQNDARITNSILGNKIAYFREKYRIQHDLSNLNEAIKQIEQASVLSGEQQSLIDIVWSLILVKSNQYTVKGVDFAEINDMLCFLVTS